MASRGLYFTPSGKALIVVICRKLTFIRADRVRRDDWRERLPTIDGWVVAVYAESEQSLWLYSALSGIWGMTSTGGLVPNLKRARDASVAYEVQWAGPGLKVALCDQDPAFEGGLGDLTKEGEAFRRGEIPMPPWIARGREIRTALPGVDAIMLPASPQESNVMRIALGHTLLIRPQALVGVKPDRALTLTSPYGVVLRTMTHRAPDRMGSLEDPPGRKLWVAPRVAYNLTRRRVAQVKDAMRRIFVEKPKESLPSVREFLADGPKETLGERLRSLGFLFRSLLEGWAAFLFALAALIGALSRAGLL
jgi:hypothetical protein